MEKQPWTSCEARRKEWITDGYNIINISHLRML